ncbi:unnamed protein product [Macrosiphum euphorbiae]|uniref:Uncharacterized protein n=1 Tax=Macrosiphum euphorbiae TaxID=13131 RepID=A0AAV0WTG8_9HEMI|nr:unnamed protein product [Macrosiphum euphorbiae]
MGDKERLMRNKQRAAVKRDAAASHIESIYALGLSASTDSSVIPKFLIASEDIQNHWETFTLENDTMLEAMIELGTHGEFSNNVELEVRNTLLDVKALANKFRSSSDAGVAASVTSNNDKPGSDIVNDNVDTVSNPTAQLPKIPLPTFDGRLQNWPDFRDRLTTLVGNRTHLSNREKFYYLLGCLQSGPSDVVKGITVSESTYELAWSALVQRYDKPRQLATTLVNEMLNAQINHQESPAVLINFLNTFCENIALLQSLNIPDLGSFLLFAISVRCLPSTTRRLFEQGNTADFPTVDSLLYFAKDRVEVLENSGSSLIQATVKPQAKLVFNKPKHTNSKPNQSGSKAPRSHQGSPVALFANKPAGESHRCEQCNGSHSLTSCSTFKDLSIDDRYALASKHRLCMVCFGSNHWANKCKSSCSVFHGRHHQLLHRDNSHAKIPPSKDPVASYIGTQHSRSCWAPLQSMSVM